MRTEVIYHGDCLNIIKQFPPASIHLIVTSPPYGELRAYGKDKSPRIDYPVLIQELFRVMIKGGVVAWVAGDQTINGSETGSSFRQALQFMDAGFRLHDTMIYRKENYIPLNHNRYEQCFEYMFVFSKGRPRVFNPIRIPCKFPGKVEKYGKSRRQNFGANHSMRAYKETEYIPTKDDKIHPNIFSYTVGKDKLGHPAPFPEQLAEDHIRTWSNEGDIVMDPFAGSGTSLKMAYLNKRRFIGIEINEDYCEMGRQRILRSKETL